MTRPNPKPPILHTSAMSHELTDPSAGAGSPQRGSRRRKVWLMRARRLLYLFALFLPPALIAATFQTFVVSLPLGLAKDWARISSAQGLAGIITISNLKWASIAAALSAAGLLRFDKRLQTFWVIAVTWGSACLLADVVTMPMVGQSVPFLINVVADLNFGGAIGGIYAWFLISIIGRWGTQSRRVVRSAVASLTPLPDTMVIDFKAISTGYAGMYLIGFFWMFATLGPIFIGIASLGIRQWIINASGRSDMVSRLLIPSSSFISVLAPLVLYLLVLAWLRTSVNAVLGSRPRASLLFFILVSLAFFVTNGVMLATHWERLLTFNSLTLNTSVLICMVGLFAGSQPGQMPLRPMKQQFGYWRSLFFRMAAAARPLQTYIPLSISEALRIWFRAVRRPAKTIERLMSIRDPITQRNKIWELSKASIGLTFLTAVPLFWLLNVRIKETLFRVPTYALLMFTVLIGGATFHVVFRIFRRPSFLRTTTAIYAIPQLIFMPLISTISIPLLYSHYMAVEKLREQHLPFSALPQRLLLLLLLSGGSGKMAKVLIFFIGLLTMGMQVLFLEASWQTYRTSRVRSYAAGALAALIAGILVTFTITPARDFVVYLAGG